MTNAKTKWHKTIKMEQLPTPQMESGKMETWQQKMAQTPTAQQKEMFTNLVDPSNLCGTGCPNTGARHGSHWAEAMLDPKKMEK